MTAIPGTGAGCTWCRLHRFAGDTRKGAIDSLPWLEADLAAYAADGRPVILFQHYRLGRLLDRKLGPGRHTFDDGGAGPPHWWSPAERDKLAAALASYNVVAILHGHQHESALIYRRGALDLFKPKAGVHGRVRRSSGSPTHSSTWHWRR